MNGGGGQGRILIYQEAEHAVEVRLDTERDTVWLSLQQLADLFERDKSVIYRHIRNIYQEGELERGATVAKNATVQTEGDRRVRREIELYNLDATISVGYRVNSRRAVQFNRLAALLGNLDQSVFGEPGLSYGRIQGGASDVFCGEEPRSPMATSAVPRSCPSIFCTATDVSSTRQANP